MTITSPGGRRLRRLTPHLVAVLALAGCGTISSSPPPATPTDFPGLAGRLNAVGIEARDWISGKSGCADDELRKTAIRFEAGRP